MPPARLPAPHRRLDAVAFALLLCAVVLAAALVSYPPIVGNSQNVLGASGDQLAASLLDTLGFACAMGMFGGIIWLMLYAAGAKKIRLGAQFIGWLLLSFTAATAVDFVGVQPQAVQVSAYGPGGAIGAWCRFQLDAMFPMPMPWVVLALVALLGLIFIARGVVRVCALFIMGILKRFAHVVEVLFNWFTPKPVPQNTKAPAQERNTTKIEPEPITLTAEADMPFPIIRHAAPEPERAFDDFIPEDLPPIDQTPPPAVVPIHRHSEPNTAGTGARIPTAPQFDHTDPGTNLPEGYELPPLSLLADPEAFPVEDHEQRLRDRAALLEKTFLDFGLNIKVVGIHTGPVITQYEVALETGLRLNKVTNLADDLALNLGVNSVRIVAPLPGRNTVGIEVPNDHRQTVRLKELIQHTGSKAAKYKLPIFLGKDVEGRPLVYDMADMPHLLIAGRTGTGKSVCLNVILNSFLFTRRPDECRLILIDPKKVEFSEYGRIPHLMHPVVVDDKKAEAILAWAVDKMEDRYEQLRKARVRNVASYNELGWAELVKRINPQTQDELDAIPRQMPYIVVVVDEVGDLLMTMKKEVETHIIRLAQKSRAAGIHLILATQKPTVDVITGLIKSNLPARICFQVASRADSAVVLDEKGAEKLLGQGDMLFLQPRTSTIIRGQGAYVDDREIERVCEAMAEYEPNFESELLNLKTKDQPGSESDIREKMRERDPMYEQAIEIVIREQRGSTSLLQRALGIGYGRASRLIDFMAEDGIVGGYNGSNAREVLVSSDDWETRKRGS